MRRTLLLFASIAILAACGREPPPGAAIAEGSTVLALGDSLTYGTGARRDESWPALLANRTGWTVINAGIPGDVSSGAAARVGALLAEHEPRLVIISIGGNDFLRRISADETRANLTAIVQETRASGAEPLLVAVPQPSIAGAVLFRLDDHPLYSEVANELGVPLLAGAWSAVLSDTTLKADALHANAAGYARFTDRLYEWLAQVGYVR